MKKNAKWILLALLLVLLIVGASGLYNSLKDKVEPSNLVAEATTVPSEEPAADPNATAAPAATPRPAAPDFTVYDVEGNAVALSSMVGKPVVVNFWASWCGPCKSEMPEFEDAYLAYGNDVHFLVVNLTDGVQETVTSASEYIAEQGYTFPVYYDTDMDAAVKYGVSAVPVTYFIDAQGNFVAYGQGALTAAALQQGIDILLGTK